MKEDQVSEVSFALMEDKKLEPHKIHIGHTRKGTNFMRKMQEFIEKNSRDLLEKAYDHNGREDTN